jgi:hypothetical protein
MAFKNIRTQQKIHPTKKFACLAAASAVVLFLCIASLEIPAIPLPSPIAPELPPHSISVPHGTHEATIITDLLVTGAEQTSTANDTEIQAPAPLPAQEFASFTPIAERLTITPIGAIESATRPPFNPLRNVVGGTTTGLGDTATRFTGDNTTLRPVLESADDTVRALGLTLAD